MFEKVEPRKLAYDKPSPKLLGFLRKHYGLSSYISQNNNFVVYNQYFEDQKINTANSNLSSCGQKLICKYILI